MDHDVLLPVAQFLEGVRKGNHISQVGQTEPTIEQLFTFVDELLINKAELLSKWESFLPGSFVQEHNESTRDWSLRLQLTHATIEHGLEDGKRKTPTELLTIFLDGLRNPTLRKHCKDRLEDLKKGDPNRAYFEEVVAFATKEVEENPKYYSEPRGRKNPSAKEAVPWRTTDDSGQRLVKQKDGKVNRKRKQRDGDRDKGQSNKTPKPQCPTCKRYHSGDCKHAGKSPEELANLQKKSWSGPPRPGGRDGQQRGRDRGRSGHRGGQGRGQSSGPRPTN
jgi:hypothetical protein